MSTASRFLPILTWLPRYQREWLRFDVIAGLTTWALVVPQAIAYGQLAGLPPQAGLFTAFASLLAYALFATSRHLVVSPTSSTAIVSAALVAPLAAGSLTDYYNLSALLAVLVGVVFVVYGLLRLGFISQFIAASVQAGLMFGLGLTIIATQLPKVLGIPAGEGAFFSQASNVLRHLGETNLWTAALGIVCLAALLIGKRVAPRFPTALAVVVGSILVVTLLGLVDRGVEVIGRVDTQLPRPAIPTADLSDVGILLLGAIVLSLIGYAESDAVAEQFATKHRYDVRPDQELVALGAANVAAGLFQGFLAAGGASQTAASESAGAKTQLSGLIVSGLIMLTAVALMPLFANLAQAVLGAIVISAVIGFINVPALRRIYHLRRESFALSMIALFGVLILGVLPGLILALLISIVLILVYLSRPRLSPLGQMPDRGDFASLERSPDAQVIPGLLVSRLDAPLFAFNAKHLRRTLLEQVQAADPASRVVVLDLEMTSDLDVQSLSTLAELNRELRLQGKELWLAQVHGRAQDMLARDGLIDQIGEDHIFRTLDGAVAAFSATEKETVK